MDGVWTVFENTKCLDKGSQAKIPTQKSLLYIIVWQWKRDEKTQRVPLGEIKGDLWSMQEKKKHRGELD